MELLVVLVVPQVKSDKPEKMKLRYQQEIEILLENKDLVRYI